VRTGCRKADDVAIGADAARDAFAELQQHAGRLSVRIGDREGLVRLEIGDIGEAVRRIIDPGRSGRGFGLRYHRRNRGSGGGKASAAQKRRRPASTILSQWLMDVLLGRAGTPTGGVSSGMTGTPTGRASLF
jgi:hypothetical protein